MASPAPVLQTKTQNTTTNIRFIQGGKGRVAWWRDYLSDFLPTDRIRRRQVLDLGCSVGEISRGLIDRGARVVGLRITPKMRCAEPGGVNPAGHGIAAAFRRRLLRP